VELDEKATFESVFHLHSAEGAAIIFGMRKGVAKDSCAKERLHAAFGI
jgi:hypothetical protein